MAETESKSKKVPMHDTFMGLKNIAPALVSTNGILPSADSIDLIVEPFAGHASVSRELLKTAWVQCQAVPAL